MSSDTVQVVSEIYVLKLPISIVQRLALHQNGVEFCHQYNGAIRTSVTSQYDDVQRRAKFVTNIHIYTYTVTKRLPSPPKEDAFPKYYSNNFK